MNAGTALGLRRRVASGDLEPDGPARDALARAEAVNPRLNAFITIARERAIARAEGLRRRDGPALPLLGVPIAVKDNICTRGVRTTAGSKVLEQYVPPYDATVIERLEAAGAVIVAKTNCDEFAMGSSTEHSAFGAARNPWDVSRIAGGSSGGSAVAVATRVVPLALGSETGGSVRQPAALCGVIGLKPTYGRISRYGLLAFASSLDQVGIFGVDAGDVAACLGVLAGADPRDSTSAEQTVPDYGAQIRREITGLRIGIPRALLDGVDAGVRAAFDSAIEVMRDAGAVVDDVELPHGRHATATYAILAMAEASSNLSRYDGVRYGARAAEAGSLEDLYARSRAAFGHEVKRRIMLGTYVLSAGYFESHYLKARQVQILIREDYERAFERVDLVATPSSPTAAFGLGERVAHPVDMYLADVFTVSANLAGVPAISVPCGFSAGLPVGLQLTAPAFAEATLLRAAAAFGRVTPWSAMQPPR